MSTLAPRVVVVTRPTELEALLAEHGTRAQARFVLDARGGSLEEVEARHAEQAAAVAVVLAAIPLQWRRARVVRDELDRFLFARDDLVVTVGQGGLVANAAKYVDAQPVLGVNPGRYDGVLAPHPAAACGELLRALHAGRAAIEERTLVHARTLDGQELFALNEIFIGHRSHQSARYLLEVAGHQERHSSSGVVVTSGTGSTGWARSICRGSPAALGLPSPCERALAFMVREAWPSGATGTDITFGQLDAAETLALTSEMNEGGVVFGDGVEGDFLPLPFGQRVDISVAPRPLRWVG